MRVRTTTAGRRLMTAGLLCLLLAGCGTRTAGQAAPGTPAPATCAPNLPTEEDTGTPNLPTEDEPATAPNLPTEEDTGAPNPPTEEDTGAPNLPTDGDTGTPNLPTDQDTGAPGLPTDGDAGAPSCPVVDGWYDMTREFNAFHARHPGSADSPVFPGAVTQLRIRRTGAANEAWITFSTESVGKGRGDDAREIARVFGDWRHEVYGDKGTVGLRTGDGVVLTTSW